MDNGVCVMNRESREPTQRSLRRKKGNCGVCHVAWADIHPCIPVAWPLRLVEVEWVMANENGDLHCSMCLKVVWARTHGTSLIMLHLLTNILIAPQWPARRRITQGITGTIKAIAPRPQARLAMLA